MHMEQVLFSHSFYPYSSKNITKNLILWCLSHLSLSLIFTSDLPVQCLQLESIYATTWTPISLSSGLSSTTAVCLLPLDDQGKFSSLLSHVWLFATPWTAAHQGSLSITNSRSLLKLMSTELMIPSDHLILCHPLFLTPSIFPSIRVFSNDSVLCISGQNIGVSASASSFHCIFITDFL